MTSWAYLNDEGKKLWGSVFPDGVVPVRSIISFKAQLGSDRHEEEVYVLAEREITPEKFENVVDLVAKRAGGTKVEVIEQIRTAGLAIRACLTSGAGTDNIGPFLPDDLDEDEEDPYLDDEEDDEEDEFW